MRFRATACPLDKVQKKIQSSKQEKMRRLCTMLEKITGEEPSKVEVHVIVGQCAERGGLTGGG